MATEITADGVSQIQNNTVTAADLQDSAVTANKIAAGAVGASQIASGAVDSDQIALNAITSAKIASGAVESSMTTQIGGRRNLIINGAMQIHQRTGTITVNSGWNYTLDRFRGYANASDGVYTVEQSTTAPDGFYKSCKITVTTADSSIGSTQLYMFGTALEGNDIQKLNWGTASPETVTLSFWVRSSLTGTFGVTITQGDTGNPSYPASYTISSADTWERKTITIEGPTVGTWAAGTSATLQVNFDLGCGSDNRGTAGSWINTGNTRYGTTGATDVIATNGATFYITGVQLEVGTVATPFEHRSFGEEMELCKRYYQKSFDYGTAPAFDTSENQIGISMAYNNVTATGGAIELGVEMRSTPTVTYYSRNVTTGNYWGMYKNTTWIVTTTGNNGSRGKRIQFYVQPSGAGMTAQNVYELSGNWTAEAEL